MVKIGIISFAHMHAYGYAQCINSLPNAELAGVYDDSPSRGRKMAKGFGVRYCQELKALLSQDMQAVVICSENANHRKFVEAAARAGKHILCEKPLATTMRDARAIVEACEKYNVQCETAFPVRFAPAAQSIKKKLDAKAIGTILAISATNHGKIPPGWFLDKRLSGGGAVIDHTVHNLDLMRWFTGAEPVSVYAEIDTRLHKGIKVDDIGILTIEFSNGMFVTQDASWSRPKSYPTWGDVTMEIISTQGTMSMDVFAQIIQVSSDATMRIKWPCWTDNMDLGLVKDFVDAVENSRPVSITAEDGMRAVEVALAAYRSARTHKPVILSTRPKLN
jgi:predicted dehydrogenase